jgi:hypothetical protein
MEADCWRAESTGTSHEADGMKSAGVLLIHEPSQRRILGRLNPADVAKPTDARLSEALAANLADLGRKLPAIFVHELDDGREGFEILNETYVSFVVDPNNTKPGYTFTDRHALIDESTTRHDLSKFFGATERQIDALIERARRSPIRK